MESVHTSQCYFRINRFLSLFFLSQGISPERHILDSEVYANFRPISKLIYVSKLTEKVVAKQLIEHVCSNGLDEVFQSAYKNFHSTETALVKIYNDILIDIDKNRTIILLLLDLSAAFDMVDHEILLYLASRLVLVMLRCLGSDHI